MGCGSSKSTVAVAPVKIKSIDTESKTNDSCLESETRPSRPLPPFSASLPINEDQPQPQKNSSCVHSEAGIANKTLGSQYTRILVKESTDSANGSRSSLDSLRGSGSGTDSRPGTNTNTDSTRETSATSRITTDSGVCDDEENEPLNMITEESDRNAWGKAAIDQRPKTPVLAVQGNKVTCGKLRKRSSLDSNNNLAILPPCGNNIALINRPQSRHGNFAFDIVLCPETANVRRKPEKLAQLEMKSSERRKKKKKSRTMTIEEWEEKQKSAAERRKLREEEKQEKARLASNSHTLVTPIPAADLS